MAAPHRPRAFGIGDRATVKGHAIPKHWRGRSVLIVADETWESGGDEVYRVEWVEDNTENTSMFPHEMDRVKPKADQTINIDFNLGLDVATMTAQVVAAVAKSLRDAADQIEGKA